MCLVCPPRVEDSPTYQMPGLLHEPLSRMLPNFFLAPLNLPAGSANGSGFCCIIGLLDGLPQFELLPLPKVPLMRRCTRIQLDLALEMISALRFARCLKEELMNFYALCTKTVCVTKCFSMHFSSTFWHSRMISQVSHPTVLISCESLVCSYSSIGNQV